MDRDEFLKALMDRYETTELVELLGLSTEDIIDAFYERIMENEEALWEELQYGH